MDRKTDAHLYCAHALPLRHWPPLGVLEMNCSLVFAVVIQTSKRHCILCWSNPKAKLIWVICRIMHYIYINSRDLLQLLCQRWMNTHQSLYAQAKRPMDISWHLHKLPASRGIYTPRLLSIIRLLSFFSPLLYQTPCSDGNKILISVPMPWQRAIEMEIQGGADVGGWREVEGGAKKVHKITKNVFLSRWIINTHSRMDRWLTELTPGVFSSWDVIDCVCVCMSPCGVNARAQIWCVSITTMRLTSLWHVRYAAEERL